MKTNNNKCHDFEELVLTPAARYMRVGFPYWSLGYNK
jgi:hypothetical protein